MTCKLHTSYGKVTRITNNLHYSYDYHIKGYMTVTTIACKLHKSYHSAGPGPRAWTLVIFMQLLCNFGVFK